MKRREFISDLGGAGKALSRRSVLTGLAATCVATSAKWSRAAEIGDGPSFFVDGPDAELYGAGENYPIKDRWRIYQPGNPASPKYRVGAFSHYDEIFPTRHVDRAATAWPFKRTPADVSYQYKGSGASLAEYLARNPVTGLLIAKDDVILTERYQYGRTDRDRLISQSMAKIDHRHADRDRDRGRRDQVDRRCCGDLCSRLERHGIRCNADTRAAAHVVWREVR